MTNALASETSPYLRQHAENPVDWLPWGADALARAKRRGVPMLLSIGYSACHWCHVMEHESFEDDEIARQMNAGFVCVKVDREERPDIDALYMEAVQGMTGHGGWPLTVFLTPDGVPFYGGTYFPPQPRPGMPSFGQVLLAVGEAWSERGEAIAAGGGNMRERLVGGAALRPSSEGFDERALEAAVQGLRDAFDALHGGFGGAPKFPQASAIEFLLCRAEPTGIAPTGSQAPGAAGNQDAAGAMTLYTLRSMAGGGINDQLGGGFHRYAVDASWTVPHFEKMLYDNALLARAYLHGAHLAEDVELLAVAIRTLDWMLDEMRGPEGGFYSALDADSEGVEGRFYVWAVSEMRGALGDDADADAAIRWLGASEQGNFVDPHHPRPGLNVLEDRGPRPDHATRERIRAALLSARERRTRPGLDDKRLTSWNALAVSALAEAGAYLLGLPAGEPVALPGGPHAAGRRYLDAAVTCAEFVLRDLRGDDSRLLRTYSGGEAKIAAYLEDHAFLLEALIALFEATCEERWLREATALADTMIERFGDSEHGGFFSTATDGEALIARRKELEDSPIPAGGSSAALGLLRLAQLTGEQRYEQASAGTISLLSQIAPRHPSAFGHMLQAMHWTLAPMRPIACALPSRR